MAGRVRTVNKSPSGLPVGDEPLEPELIRLIEALARDAARRDHADELAQDQHD